MGSTSSSFHDNDYNAADIWKKIKQANDQTEYQQYETEVNGILNRVLAISNDRDNATISGYITSVRTALEKEIDGTVSTMFGGSLSRNTHINGMSDVDTLVILNDNELASGSPDEALDYFCDRLKERFPKHEVTKGDTAVTILFRNTAVQLVPAIKFKSGLKIPDGNEWSAIVKPTVFARRLTLLNKQLGGRLVPTIKLLKNIISNYPSNVRLKGYHVESLALQIFEPIQKGGPILKSKELVLTFFREAKEAIKIPIKDVTNQSQYIDSYLGGKASLNRLMASSALDRTYRRLEMADLGKITSIWNDLIAPNE